MGRRPKGEIVNRCKFCTMPLKPNEPDEDGLCAFCAWYLAEPSAVDCPHGKPADACDACDVASDFAYDAAREG